MIFFQIFIGNELHIGRRVDSVKLTDQVTYGARRLYDIDCQAAFSISYVVVITHMSSQSRFKYRTFRLRMRLAQTHD